MESIGKRTQYRRRTRSRVHPQNMARTITASLWSLPEEVLLHLLEKLHIKELLVLTSTNSYFRDLIYNNGSVWTNVSFHGTWPTVPNMRHFAKAAQHDNIEALVKLGVAFLYNEGLPGDFEGKKITTNGERAAEMFCRVEACTPHTSPFTWLFIRPPWALAGACCKECVFNNMKQYVSKTPEPSVYICIAKTMGILSLEDYKTDIEENLIRASKLGSQEAAFLLWTQKYCQCCRALDSGAELQSLRELRSIALSGYFEAQLVLSKRYVTGNFGGISRYQATTFVQGFLQSSQPTRVKRIYRFNELTHSMRYILMDWLVEVACMKDFTSLTLHMAISVVDRFLQKYKTTRAKLQLLGVAAMVLCSRFLGLEIITIREAAWLTDNTYKYEDVVRMMGEITATLQGNFRVPVSLDYVDLVNCAAKSDSETVYLSEYFCELALLQSDLGDFPMGEVAASCVLFARLVQNTENPWPNHLAEFTGYSVKDLHKCLLVMHDKCFVEQAMVDHRDVVLQAVKERYADEDYMAVSTKTIMSKTELRGLLSMPEEELVCVAPSMGLINLDLIASPCRGSQGRVSASMDSGSPDKTDREKAATPTMEAMQKANESAISGYDGDMEDEGESFIDEQELETESYGVWSLDKLQKAPCLPSARCRTISEHSESDADTYNSKIIPWSPRLHTLHTSKSSPALDIGSIEMFSIAGGSSVSVMNPAFTSHNSTINTSGSLPAYNRPSTSTRTKVLNDHIEMSAEVLAGVGSCAATALDSGTDNLSPVPGSYVPPGSCARTPFSQSIPAVTLKSSSITFKASAALNLDRISMAPPCVQPSSSSSCFQPSSSMTTGRLALGTMGNLSLMSKPESARKRRLSASATTSENKIHVVHVSPQ